MSDCNFDITPSGVTQIGEGLSASGNPDDCSTPCALVTQGWLDARQYTQAAFDTGLKFLDAMQCHSSRLADIPNVSEDLEDLPGITTYQKSARPKDIDGEIGDVREPGDPNIQTVELPTYPDAPTFDEEAPSTDIEAPPAVVAGDPDPIDDIGQETYPAEPNPDEPTLGPMIPIRTSWDDLELEELTFSEVLGSPPSAPAADFAWTENPYTSALLVELQSLLLSYVQGDGFGISQELWDAIWMRERDRQQGLTDEAVMAEEKDWDARGFPVPQRSMDARIVRIREKGLDELAESSRTKAIEQARLHVENLRFAITTAVQLEKHLMDANSELKGRALDAAKYLVQVAIDLFNGELAAWNGEKEAFLAYASVFETRIRAQGLQIENRKSEVAVEQMKNETNQTTAQIFATEWGGVDTQWNAYVKKLQKNQVRLEEKGRILQKMELDLRRFAELLKKETEISRRYDSYVQGRVGSGNIFRSGAEAYSAEMRGYEALVGATTDSKNIEMDIKQRVPMELYRTDTEAYGTRMETEIAKVASRIQVLQAYIQRQGQDINDEQGRVTSSIQTAQVHSQDNSTRAQLRQRNAEINQRKLLESIRAALEAMQQGSNVASNLVAAALSSVNLTGRISGESSDQTITAEYTNYNYSL